jgi:Ser/Thr protein kinase RdoA (MazF antagonist)
LVAIGGECGFYWPIVTVDEVRVAGSDALVAEIADRFGRPIPPAWRDLGGSWTTNLLLEYADDPLVARIHQISTSPERLAAVQAARLATIDAGIPAVRPLCTAAGHSYVTLGDGVLAELEPYVPWEQRMNNESLLTAGFGALARVHDALRAAAIPAAGHTVRYANHIHSADALAATGRGVARIREWRNPRLNEFADQVLAHIEAVEETERPLRPAQRVQLVHGDWWDNNVLFRHDRLVAVLDFDFMADRARIDDLALSAYFFLLQPGKGRPGPADRAQLRRFVAAYDAAAQVPLSAPERAALPAAIARQPAWSVGRWVVELPEPEAIEHATAAAAELPVAQAILADLGSWQAELS